MRYLSTRPGGRRQHAVVAGFAVLALSLTAPAAADELPPGEPGSTWSFAGAITEPNGVDVQVLEVSSERVTAAAGGGVLLAVRAHGDDGLEVGKVQVLSETGAVEQIMSRANAYGTSDSYTVVRVEPGSSYDLRVGSDRKTTGSYVANVDLAGDVDGSGVVDDADVQAVVGSQGALPGEAGYSEGTDIDANGHVTGHDLELVQANHGAAVASPAPEEDVPLPDGALLLSGVSESRPNPTGATLRWTLTGTTFAPDAVDHRVWINDSPVPAARFLVSETEVAVASALTAGRNVIRYEGYDSADRHLYHEAVIWAGSSSVEVNLVSEDGLPFTGTADVRLAFADNHSIGANQSWTGTTLTFPDLPNRTFVVTATTPDNLTGGSGGLAGSRLTVRMAPIGDPSPIDNNDFSLGLDGWSFTGTGTAYTVDHTEDAGPPSAAQDVVGPTSEQTPAPAGQTPEERAARNTALELDATEEAAGIASATSGSTTTNTDLALATVSEGEQNASRTFQTDPGVTAVKVRYRFITSEVPGGYFGSRYNDYYRVAIRSAGNGGLGLEANSMNAMGLPAFDASGSTRWRDLTIDTDKAGDVVQVDVAVANVADGALDSAVVVDVVEERGGRVVPTLTWNTTRGGLDLRYRVEGGPTTEATPVTVRFATGPTYGARTGATLHTHDVAADTAEGEYGPFHIPGTALTADPAGTTHLVAAAGPDDIGAVQDVSIGYGPNADRAAVSAGMLDAVKDSLRIAGQTTVTISSTARGPEDQVRAMFNNLVSPARPIAANITTQLGIYAAPGDAVINVFAARTQGMTREQITTNAATIRDAMLTEINNQGCTNVSRHCGDPAVRSVIDVGVSPFTGARLTAFTDAVTTRVDRVIDERASNSCIHLEKAV
ncbi:hypothetical protein [Myceligenerans crystallogenes]|uniref:Dockerin domain-containing protein n=1 Tax=Myceligenerans crystallogenes TaxID=316335 RepID=A0ABP4ZEH6_9MICO